MVEIGQNVCAGDVRLVVRVGWCGGGGPPDVPAGLFLPMLVQNGGIIEPLYGCHGNAPFTEQ